MTGSQSLLPRYRSPSDASRTPADTLAPPPRRSIDPMESAGSHLAAPTIQRPASAYTPSVISIPVIRTPTPMPATPVSRVSPARAAEVQSLSEIRIAVPPLMGAQLTVVSPHRSKWDRFANVVSAAVGSPVCFYGAVSIVVVWIAIGQALGWNNTWQLIMNTISSVATFLMVFILQTSQNRDTRSMQLQVADLRAALHRMEAKVDEKDALLLRLEAKLDKLNAAGAQ